MNTTLAKIAELLKEPVVYGEQSTCISGLTLDSRKVLPGWMFVAMPGEKADGTILH